MTEAAAAAPAAGKPLGTPRGPVKVVLLALITFGIYYIVYEYKTFDELERYRGQGISGGIALVLMFVGGGIALPFLQGSYVGKLYAEDGQTAPVSGKTGFWLLLPLIGIFVYMSKVQGALNRFWEGKGAKS